MRNYNRRIVWRYAFFHYTAKTEKELRTGKLDWLDLLFDLFPDKERTDYFAIAMAYLLEMKDCFLRDENNKLKELKGWYEAHFDMIVEEDFLLPIQNKYSESKKTLL
jgi:hypothetical protein